MPCQLRLPRLYDSRHTPQHIFRHAVTCRMVRQPIRQLHDDQCPAELTKEQIAKEKVRQRALRRLDEVIDPNDLSATLEAHRESNRTSVIHLVATGKSDPAIMRPSFLEKVSPFRVISAIRRNAGRKYPHKDTSLSHFAETEAKSTNIDDAYDAYQLKRLQSAAEHAREQKRTANLERRNAEKYKVWSEFLHTYEQPPQADTPEYDPKDRRTFFALLRRVSNILLHEQNKIRTQATISMAGPSMLLYNGVPRPLMSMHKGYTEPEPWNRRPKSKSGYSHQRWFDLEIKKFAEWMQMTPSEEAARAKLTEMLLELVPKAAPETGSEPFGSQVTGLTMPNSDIDIRIYELHPKDSRLNHQDFADKEKKIAWRAQQRMERKTRMTAHLSKVQVHLSKHPDFEQIELTDAHYPLVKAVHTPTGIKIQLVAAKPTDSSRAAIKKYLEEFTQLKALFLLLKTTLNLRGLSDPWHGGVGSYTVFMMCVAALKFTALETAQNNEDTSPKSLSENFLQILKFWADFDTTKMAMSIEPPLIFNKRRMATAAENEAARTDIPLAGRLRVSRPVTYKPYLLALQDPADALNDLGRSSIAILDIQMTLKKLHRDLIDDLEDPKRKINASALLKPVVGRSDRYFDDMRIPVDLWGSQFVVEEEGVMDGGKVQHEEADVEREEDVQHEKVEREEDVQHEKVEREEDVQHGSVGAAEKDVAKS